MEVSLLAALSTLLILRIISLPFIATYLHILADIDFIEGYGNWHVVSKLIQVLTKASRVLAIQQKITHLAND